MNASPSGFKGMLQRRFSVKRVLVAMTGRGMTCAWLDQGRWLFLQSPWPEGACDHGVPQQIEAMADLVADLLLDAGVVGAQIELLLPLELCDWRVLDGVEPPGESTVEPGLINRLPWSLDSDDCYCATSDCFGSLLTVGVRRSSLQSWIDLFEQADLPLARVDWILSSAWRGLLQKRSQEQCDVAWLIAHQHQSRLVLLHHGVPEVDRPLVGDPDQWLPSLQTFVEAWQDSHSQPTSLRWHFTVAPSLRTQVMEIVGLASESLGSEDSDPTVFEPFDPSQEPQLLDPLVSLGLSGLDLAR